MWPAPRGRCLFLCVRRSGLRLRGACGAGCVVGCVPCSARACSRAAAKVLRFLDVFQLAFQALFCLFFFLARKRMWSVLRTPCAFVAQRSHSNRSTVFSTVFHLQFFFPQRPGTDAEPRAQLCSLSAIGTFVSIVIIQALTIGIRVFGACVAFRTCEPHDVLLADGIIRGATGP